MSHHDADGVTPKRLLQAAIVIPLIGLVIFFGVRLWMGSTKQPLTASDWKYVVTKSSVAPYCKFQDQARETSFRSQGPGGVVILNYEFDDDPRISLLCRVYLTKDEEAAKSLLTRMSLKDMLDLGSLTLDSDPSFSAEDERWLYDVRKGGIKVGKVVQARKGRSVFAFRAMPDELSNETISKVIRDPLRNLAVRMD